MNNQGEFVDESKVVAPEVLKKLQSTAGDSSKLELDASTKLGRRPNEDSTSIPPLEAVDFISFGGLVDNAKYFANLQEVSDMVLNKFRVPFADGRFRRLVVPKTRDRIPVLPYDYFITEGNTLGGGDVTFVNWMTPNEESFLSNLTPQGEKFTVRANSAQTTQLMAEIQVWSNSYIDKGVRDTRARPSAVLGDWECMLEPDISTTHRNIRTDVLAHYMYGHYTAPNPPEDLLIINASDLRSFLNTNGCYWPVPADTLCLALGKMRTMDLGRLALFDTNIIIDFDSSMNGTRGTQITYNGCIGYTVSKISVTAQDPYVARVINETFSAIDIQWALFANTLPLAMNSSARGVLNGNNFNLRTYVNSVSDQFVNFYTTHHDLGNKLPLSVNLNAKFIQAWRVFKTAFASKVCAEIGYLSRIPSTNTYGKSIDAQNYFDLISGEFDPYLISAMPLAPNTVCWIPYELWIANGADLRLDSPDYVDGQSGILVNTNYLAPISQITITRTEWEDQTALGGDKTIGSYYVPNADTASINVAIPSGWLLSQTQCCLPATIPRYSSTTDTATLPWDKAQTIDFTYSKTGSNRNTIYRTKLVFSSAAKN